MLHPLILVVKFNFRADFFVKAIGSWEVNHLIILTCKHAERVGERVGIRLELKEDVDP
jgi:hypothetical protein